LQGIAHPGANPPPMPDTRADLGQFFTPRAVVEFALSTIADLGAPLARARVCDPACGPGEWLLAALEAGAREAVGIDCDPVMPERWHDSGLADDPRAVLAVGDGLDPSLKLCECADVVLGNPPFGTELAAVSESALAGIAAHYRLPSLRRPARSGTGTSAADLQRLRRFPAELLFLERFVELCRPGGWIAIVLPEGVFSNSRWRHVRRWLLEELTVHLVVALPRATFRAHATTARTCLTIMHRMSPPSEHHVQLCGMDECSPEALARLLEMLRSDPAVEGQSGGFDPTPPIFED